MNIGGQADNYMSVIDEMNRISSDDSDEQQVGADMVNYEQPVAQRRERIEKVGIDKFKDTVHKVQQFGFNWMLEAQKVAKVNNTKAKELVTNTILSEKDHEA